MKSLSNVEYKNKYLKHSLHTERMKLFPDKYHNLLLSVKKKKEIKFLKNQLLRLDQHKDTFQVLTDCKQIKKPLPTVCTPSL